MVSQKQWSLERLLTEGAKDFTDRLSVIGKKRATAENCHKQEHRPENHRKAQGTENVLD